MVRSDQSLEKTLHVKVKPVGFPFRLLADMRERMDVKMT